MPADCPSELILARAFTVGVDPALQAHIDGCRRCLAAWRGFDELRGVARELPVPKLADAARERVRAAILSQGTGAGRPPRRRWPVFVGVAAAAALLVLVLRGPSVPPGAAVGAGRSAPGRNGVVTAFGAARFRWVGERPDEVVRLEDGIISVEVQRLGPGERFRVRVGDGEVEVRGTGFDVHATGDRLALVRVRHGRVEVRADGRAGAILGAGESWRAGGEEPVAPAPPPSAAPARPVPSSRHRPPISPPRPSSPRVAAVDAPPARATSSPAEEHFREAWSALKAGEAARAQRELERARAATGAEALLEDIDFWRAVALERQGRHEEAARAFEEFLGRHAGSARAGEASVALGWSLLAAGHREAARGRFQAALDDRSARVRESARDGVVAARANH